MPEKIAQGFCSGGLCSPVQIVRNHDDALFILSGNQLKSFDARPPEHSRNLALAVCTCHEVFMDADFFAVPRFPHSSTLPSLPSLTRQFTKRAINPKKTNRGLLQRGVGLIGGTNQRRGFVQDDLQRNVT